MMMGTNESMYAWMDEGFTEFGTDLIEKYYRDKVTRVKNVGNAAYLKRLDSLDAVLPLMHSDNYRGYYALVKSGFEEPLTTHADHFNTNYAYSNAAYSKGSVFMEQLGYIIGADVRDKMLLEYYNQWHFKHPNSNDLVQVAEKISGIKLDWYKEYFCNTTKTINYAIDSLWEEDGVSKIRLKRIGQMPMPIDLQLTFKDGSKEMHYVPLDLMFGQKPNENPSVTRIVHDEWRWTHPTYIVETKRRLTDLKVAEIDPTKRMADVEQKNNLLELNW
jgi:aminopeptidase N